MQTKVSTKGQVVLPQQLRQRLGILSGDPLDISVEAGTIILTPLRPAKYQARIITDPVTGFPVIDVGPDAPVLTSEMVEDMLKDFP
jgi:AbrB family looped-hinge helix DNA binding protein